MTKFSGQVAALSPEEMRIFLEVIPLSIGIARGAADMAESYRGVHVGSVAVGLSADGSEILFSDGWNTKPDPQATKFCAEMRSLLGARNLEFGRVLGLVVAGPTDPEVIESINPASDTLKPCKACQTFMSACGDVGQDLPILSVGRHVDMAEFTSLGELVYADGAAQPSSGGKFLFSARDWTSVMQAYDYLSNPPEGGLAFPVDAARVALLNSVPVRAD